MSRRFAVLLLAGVFAPGCVPVTEPVGDAEKAEPDKSLVGNWAEAEKPDKPVLRIETPEVKGNPKGLMRWVALNDKKEDAVWFFVATAGKEKYANLCMDVGNKDNGAADFGKEGDYAKWMKSPGRRYFVFHYTTGKDSFVINFGDEDAFKKLMKDEKIEMDNTICFKTPAGWLDKYLTKAGRDPIFPVTKDTKLVKAK